MSMCQVSSLVCSWLTTPSLYQTEEFNKYLSYVRNLGFEDTPDYDYLRDLFTTALKSTGEVEDGEYDWMKLNNGKGWEAMKAHPSQAHLHHNAALQNTSAREVHANRASKTPIPPGRLEAELPKPGATRQGQPPAAQRHQSGRREHYSQDYTKRRSGGGELAPPEGSTTAQFANSSGNLPGARQSTQQPPNQMNRQTTTPSQAAAARGQAQPQEDQKPSGMQKFLNVLCCR